MNTNEIEWNPETLREIVRTDAGVALVLEQVTNGRYAPAPENDEQPDKLIETYPDGSQLVWVDGECVEFITPSSPSASASVAPAGCHRRCVSSSSESQP